MKKMAPIRARTRIFVASLSIVSILSFIPCVPATHVPEEDGSYAERWLRSFGYLPRASRQMSSMQSTQMLTRAVSRMQRFYGLEVTGQLNAATITAMRQPRCSLPDVTPEEFDDGTRRKRYVLTGQRWDKDHITYSILTQQIPPSLGEQRTFDTIRRAFDMWERATPLTFKELPAAIGSNQSSLADIMLLFASGFHGDTSLFDGEGGSLAHAFYPGPGMGGDIHFDADEHWTSDNQGQIGIDLFVVAVHELGHALGLEHSDNPGAIMAPLYRWIHMHNFSLHDDDIRGVQSIYGPPRTAPPVHEDRPDSVPPASSEPPVDGATSPSHPQPEAPLPTERNAPPPEPNPRTTRPPVIPTAPPDTEPTTPPVRKGVPPPPPRPPPPPPRPPKLPDDQPPNICDGDFDTVTLLRGEMFVFKGRWFWRVRRNRVLDNYPMPISVFWIGLPSNIDAAYERHDGKFVFFKDDKFWIFREADVLPGYPQPLREYGKGVPVHKIDTAIWWEPNGFTYFFSGDRYWRFNEQTRSTDIDFPKPNSRWGRIPDSPKGAFLSDDSAYTYIYQGSNYWRFDNHRTEADKGYPRSILKDFMGCREAPDPKPDTDGEREPKRTPVNPTGPGQDEPRKPDRDKNSEKGQTSKPDTAEDDEDKQVNVVVTVADNETKVMTLVMVIVPLVLILCILILIYAILRTVQNKESPRALIHCKRSLQEWV